MTQRKSKPAEKERFVQLAHRLREARDPKQRKRIKQKLARLTFGR